MMHNKLGYLIESMQNFNYNQEVLHLLQVLMWVANVTTVVR